MVLVDISLSEMKEGRYMASLKLNWEHDGIKTELLIQVPHKAFYLLESFG